jgi:tetratricopeptide (TPR) repeat protein
VTNAAPAPEIHWIDDRYDVALAEAKRAHKPIFVDTWASWCHSCLSLRQFVFPDPKIRAKSADFVWLAIDTEKPAAEAFLSTHPMGAWPTLWVIDSATERPVLKWIGSATADELASLLDDAKLAVASGSRGGEAGVAWVKAMQETAEGKNDEAIADYRRAIELAPQSWPKRAQAIEALSWLLRATKDCEATVDLAVREGSGMRGAGTSAKNVLTYGLLCVERLPDASRASRLDALAVIAEKIAQDEQQPMLADDRSELYEYLVDTLNEQGRKDDARRIAGAWSVFLDAQVAHTRTPAQRAVFDAHRFEAYLAIGAPELAVPMLERSAADFPDDYNPPARLASTFLAMKRYDDARKQIDRALSLANGPRKLRLFATKADILAALGDKAGEKVALDAALAHAKGLALTGSAARLRDALAERARRLERPSGGSP